MVKRCSGLRIQSNLRHGQSEDVAQRILDIAAEKCSILVTIFRMGLIAGPRMVQKDVWDKCDRIPCFPKTTRALSGVPEMLGAINTIDQIPVDSLAPTITKLSLSTSSLSGTLRL
jgi:hypothetical protein